MQMEAMNAEFSVRNQNRTSMRSNRVNRNNCDPPDVAHTLDSLHAMNDRELMQTYSEKEQKLSKLDTLYSAIRNFLHGSSRITSDEELDKALHQLSELREEAQHFIMLCYYDDDENPTCKRRIPPESSRSVKSEHKSGAQKICFEYEVKAKAPIGIAKRLEEHTVKRFQRKTHSSPLIREIHPSHSYG